MHKNLLLAISLLTISLISPYIIQAQTDPAQPNILLIVADDMGTDMTPGFLEGPLMPTTPFLDSLRQTGVSFLNCWAAPQCTPTRASIMSGKYGIKTGVQKPPGNLDISHNSIFKQLNIQNSNAYDQALIGKWHVSSPQDFTHPAQHEVDFYTGVFDSQVDDYYEWDKVVNEALVEDVTEYVTTDLTNEAINWIDNRNAPWFLWLAHVAPHGPFHVPPAELYSISPTGNNKRKYIASIEAMDAELRRLLGNIDPDVLENTVIMFVGDNGTPSIPLQTYPSGTGKGTIYQGGINVPLIATGPGITRVNETEDALVNVADIFATILEVAGGTLPGGMHNSYQFADGSQEFYDLIASPLEGVNLLEGTLSAAEQSAYDDLELEALYIRIDWSCRDLIQNGIETSIDVGGANCGTIPTCSFDNTTSFTNIGCCDTPNGESEVYEIEFEDIRTITTSNFPDHDYCYNSAAQMPSPANHMFFVDATPSKAAQPISILTSAFRPNSLFGIGMNGVIMAPAPAAPFIFENTNTGEFNWNWVFEPTNNQGSGSDLVGLDCASAHTGGQGYHYHGNMFEYAEQIQSGISTTSTPPANAIQIGWAADGYPVLYRFAPDAVGTLSLLQPSYQIKSGDRPGDGVNSPCGPYNGKYTNDYEYVAGSGDLDECNGMTRDITLNTVCGPQTFDYFYVITDGFPQIPRCHVGEPNSTFDTGSETSCLTRMSTQEIALSEGQSYTVGSSTYDQVGTYCDTIMGSNSCDSIIVTKITALLPLDLISFEALNRQDKWVDALWETIDEKEVSHFEIERSFNTAEWEFRGKVNARGNLGNSNYYQYQDDWSSIRSQAFSKIFYRLKIVDTDGSYQYSNIKTVEKSQEGLINIFHDRNENSIHLESGKDWEGPIQISILDVLGQPVQSKMIQIKQGRQMALKLDNLPANLYFVLLEDKYNLLATKKIVVNR